MYYVTFCFLPTFMLGMLAYATFYIDISDFNDRFTLFHYNLITNIWCTRFMGSLTALLVLATLESVFTADLPKASYTKVGGESEPVI